MNIKAIRTPRITEESGPLTGILDRAVKNIPEKSILVVTSKIVALCEGHIDRRTDKDTLIQREAEWYLPRQRSKYHTMLTIKYSHLFPAAGVDHSNAAGAHVMLPKHPKKSANAIRTYLQKRFRRQQIGVIISDSTTRPLRWGTTGVAIAHSGFLALKDYRGTKDLFGHPMYLSQANHSDALAAAAVAVMGEGTEQTPLALITKLPFVQFQKRNPSPKEIRNLHINKRDDLYGPLLNAVRWRKGKG
ncbi:MAG: coenzyme F420-0:L-glutamate ligase [Candidatus Nomurabacteria bacterium]|nr:MAG: coenzyme F420-0:L-glutamate ligase [Candidatus Nomurabacteria bacterium]